MGLWPLVTLTYFLLLLYGFCALSSIAITRSRSSRLRELSRSGYWGASYARLILTRAESYLLACYIGSFLSAFLAGFCIAQIVTFHLLPRVTSLKEDFGAWESGVVVFVSISLTALIGISIVQVARAVAFNRPTRSLCLVSPMVISLSRLLSPIALLLRWTLGSSLKALGVDVPAERELAVSAEELSEIVDQSTKAGEIEEEERDMIQHVFTFSDTVVREVMTPRADIVFVEETASLKEVVQVFTAERLSRILVAGKNLDDVRGVLMAKDLLPLFGRVSLDSGVDSFDIKKLLRPAYFVANTKQIDDLLKDLRREAVHFAVVLDEHGGVDGVVTIEDLVEELVGEIFDEYDSPHDEADIQKTKSGDLIVDGSIIIDDLNSQYSLHIPSGEYDTFAGYVIHTLGRIPSVGESLDYNGHRIKVEEVDQNRITQLRVSVVPEPTLAGASAHHET